jgi:putative membrane protein
MMGWYGDGGWGWGAWLAMSLMMLVFWGGLVAVLVMLVRSVRQPGAPQDASGDARRILDERFARGELDEEDYVRRRDLLGRR